MTGAQASAGERPVRGSPMQSVRARLVLWNAATLVLLLVLLGVVTHFFVRSYLLATVDRELMAETDRIVNRPPPPDGIGLFRGEPGVGPGGPFDLFRRRNREPANPLRTRVFGANGKALRLDDTASPIAPEGLRSAVTDSAAFLTTSFDGGPVRVLYRRLPSRGGPIAVVQAALPLGELNEASAKLDQALLMLAPLALVLAGLGGLLITRHVLRPVALLTHAAAQIGAADLSARLGVTGHDEFAELASTFNGMLARLETAFREQLRLVEQQRRFVADASHELRTPLTVVKGNTSLCLSGHPTTDEYRQSIEEINRAADAMSRLVLDLLLLARSDAHRLARDPITLPIAEVLHGAAAAVARREPPVRVDASDPALCVRGNEDEITRVFVNLLDNAARCTREGGGIALSAVREAGDVVVTVTDTGIGIAPEHLPHLGERFYRVDESRSRGEGGSGLGLSICKSIVEAHGGSISFASEPGCGTTVTVRLPAADGGPGAGAPSSVAAVTGRGDVPPR